MQEADLNLYRLSSAVSMVILFWLGMLDTGLPAVLSASGSFGLDFRIVSGPT